MIGRTISHRDYAAHLKQMYTEGWLIRSDEKIRGKSVLIKITTEGKLAHKYHIKLEESTMIHNALRLILISSAMGISYLKEASVGKRLRDLSEYDLTTKYSFYEVVTRNGIGINDLVKKNSNLANEFFHHGTFDENIVSDLLERLVKKEVLVKKLFSKNGQREYRYLLVQSSFGDFIQNCVLKLHTEITTRMNYLWRNIRKPKAEERTWYKNTHGSEGWITVEISNYDFRRSKNDLPYMWAESRLSELDDVVISNYNDLRPQLENIMEDEKYGYYSILLFNDCFPKFLRECYRKKNLLDIVI